MPKINSNGFTQRSEAKMRKQGFTIIELLIVIAVLGTLATIGLITLPGATSHARDTRRMSDLKQYQTTLETYYSSHDEYPSGSGSITGLCGDLGISSCPDDPKDSTYRYSTNGQQFTIDVELEAKTTGGQRQFFVVCSNGLSGVVLNSFSPSGGNCPSF